MSSSPSLVTLGPHRMPLQCLVCKGQLFADRRIKMNTGAAEFLGMGWADQSGTALICDQCGFVHTFAGSEFELWAPDGGYPG